METIKGKKGDYDLIQLVSSSKFARTFSCRNEDGEYLLRLSNAPKYNQRIAITVQKLQKLKALSDEYEADTEYDLNYDFGFPYVVDDFIDQKTNGKRCQACVLGFRGVESIEKLIPVSNFVRDMIAPDIRSSAWILGKLLKTIHFAHSCGTPVKNLGPSNILIEPDQHYVVVFDWSKAHFGEVRATDARDDIRQAADTVIELLGSSPYLLCHDEMDRRYAQYLIDVQQNGSAHAAQAHERHYKLVDKMCDDDRSYWSRGFHEFTTTTY